jgi:hypothetical protein
MTNSAGKPGRQELQRTRFEEPMAGDFTFDLVLSYNAQDRGGRAERFAAAYG